MARGILAEGRLLDASRMIEPLIDRSVDAQADASQIVLRCLAARVHLLRHADSRKVMDLLGSYESSEVRAALDAPLRAEVALWLGWSTAWQDDERYDEARALNVLEEAEHAFEECMNHSGRCWTRIAQAHVYFTIDEYELMLQALSDAAALQERLTDVAAKAWIDHLSVVGARFEGRYEAAHRHVDALERFGRDMNDDYATGRALAHRAVLHYELGRKPDDTISTARKAEAMLRRSAVEPGYSLLSAYHAHIGAAIRAGRWKEADRVIDEALEQIGFLGTAPAYITLHRARLNEYRGDHGVALELIDDVSRRIDRQHRLLAASVHHVSAGILIKEQAFDAAGEHGRKALRCAREAGHIGYQLQALLQNVRVEIERENEEEARRLVREAERHADYFSILPLAAQRFLVHGYLSVLRNRADEARAYFTQSLSAFSLIGDEYSVALVQCELARLGNTPGEARNLAASALRTSERLGAVPLARAARSLLRNAPPEGDETAVEHEANIGAIMARAAISVDLVAEAWLQAAEALAPGRWLVVYRYDEEHSWSLVHKHGVIPSDLPFPDPSLERICENGVDWVRLRGLPAPAFFFGMECGGDDDPACAAIEKRLEPWIPVVGLALEHALLRSSRLSVSGRTDYSDQVSLVADGDGRYFTGLAANNVRSQIRRVRTGHSPVLINGETGVGKRRAARTIHLTGDRREGPFKVIRCSTRPVEALETMLFGTADDDHPGALLGADGGTLYLEDIDELPFEAQSRLLHFLREGSLSRVGHDAPMTSDVRVIASTTKDLQMMVREGRFREDLYYRLNVVPIRIPPLRRRREEIPLLVQHFLRDFTADGQTAASITSRALDVLIQYDWPGNVRQLRNEIERLIEDTGSEPFSMIDIEDLSPVIRDRKAADTDLDSGGAIRDISLDGKGLDDILAVAERSVIEQALRRHRGQVSATAEALGLSRQGLYKKLKRLGIELTEFQPEPVDHASEPS